jgi:hypothetical protein
MINPAKKIGCTAVTSDDVIEAFARSLGRGVVACERCGGSAASLRIAARTDNDYGTDKRERYEL